MADSRTLTINIEANDENFKKVLTSVQKEVGAVSSDSEVKVSVDDSELKLIEKGLKSGNYKIPVALEFKDISDQVTKLGEEIVKSLGRAVRSAGGSFNSGVNVQKVRRHRFDEPVEVPVEYNTKDAIKKLAKETGINSSLPTTTLIFDTKDAVSKLKELDKWIDELNKKLSSFGIKANIGNIVSGTDATSVGVVLGALENINSAQIKNARRGASTAKAGVKDIASLLDADFVDTGFRNTTEQFVSTLTDNDYLAQLEKEEKNQKEVQKKLDDVQKLVDETAKRSAKLNSALQGVSNISPMGTSAAYSAIGDTTTINKAEFENNNDINKLKDKARELNLKLSSFKESVDGDKTKITYTLEPDDNFGEMTPKAESKIREFAKAAQSYLKEVFKESDVQVGDLFGDARNNVVRDYNNKQQPTQQQPIEIPVEVDDSTVAEKAAKIIDNINNKRNNTIVITADLSSMEEGAEKAREAVEMFRKEYEKLGVQLKASGGDNGSAMSFSLDYSNAIEDTQSEITELNKAFESMLRDSFEDADFSGTLGRVLKRDLISARGEAESSAKDLGDAVSRALEESVNETEIETRLVKNLNDAISAVDELNIDINVDPADGVVALQTVRDEIVEISKNFNDSGGNVEELEKKIKALLNLMVRLREVQRNSDASYQERANLYSSVAPEIKKESAAYRILTTEIRRAREATRDLNNERNNQRTNSEVLFTGLNAFTSFGGRASKGWGSFAEALSIASNQLINYGNEQKTLSAQAALFGRGLSIVSASVTAISIPTKLLVDTFNRLSSVISTVINTVVNTLKPGYELYTQMTKGALSFTAALRSMGTVEGRQLTANQSAGVASQMMVQAQYKAFMSAFSYEEIISALQGILPLVMSKGGTAQQAMDLTTGVAAVAKQTSLSSNQILQETRDLMQGTITARTSQVANALGITNDDINRYEGNIDELYNYLVGKFKEYEVLMNTYSRTLPGAFEQLEEIFSMAGSRVVDRIAPQLGSVAKYITSQLGDFRDAYGNTIDVDGNVYNAQGEMTRRGLSTLDAQEWANQLRDGQSYAQVEAQAGFNIAETLGLDIDTVNSLKSNVDELYGYLSQKIAEYNSANAGAFDFETMYYDLSSFMEEASEGLKRILDAVIHIIASVIDWAVAMGYVEEGSSFIDTVVDLVIFLIELYVRVAEAIVRWIDLLEPVVYVVQAVTAAFVHTLTIIKAIARTLFFVGEAATSVGVAIADALGITASGSTSTLDRLMKEYEQLSKENELDLASAKALYPWVENDMNGGQSQMSKDFLSSVENARKQFRIYSGNGGAGGLTPSDVRGIAKEDSANDKEARKAAKKYYNAQKEALKNALEDIKTQIKKSMDTVETLNKQGYLDAKVYYDKMSALKEEETRADIDYYEKLIELTKNTQSFEDENDREKELLKLYRDRDKSISTLNDILADNKAANAFAQSNAKLQNALLSDILNSNNAMRNFSDTKNGSQVSMINGMTFAGLDNAVQAVMNWRDNGTGEISDSLKNLSTDEIVFLMQKVAEFGVPIKSILALMTAESHGNQSAISPAGAIGRFQLMPGTAAGMGVDPYDSFGNILGGVSYLADRLRDFDGNRDFAYAGYNAGPGAVEDYGGIPPFQETINYVNRINEYIAEVGDNLPEYIDNTISLVKDVQSINQDYWNKVESEPGATDWDSLQPYMKSIMNELGKRYFEATGNKLSMTGAAEWGYHTGDGYGRGYHSAGDKVDIGFDSNSAVLERLLDELGLAWGREGDHYDVNGYNNYLGGDAAGAKAESVFSKFENGTIDLNVAKLDLKGTRVTSSAVLSLKEAQEQQDSELRSIAKEYADMMGSSLQESMNDVRLEYSKKIDQLYARNENGASSDQIEKNLIAINQLTAIMNQKLRELEGNDAVRQFNRHLNNFNETLDIVTNKLANGFGDLGNRIMSNEDIVDQYYRHIFGTFGQGDYLNPNRAMEKDYVTGNMYNNPVSNRLEALFRQEADESDLGFGEKAQATRKEIENILNMPHEFVTTMRNSLDEVYDWRNERLDASEMTEFQIEIRKQMNEQLRHEGYATQTQKEIEWYERLLETLEKMADAYEEAGIKSDLLHRTIDKIQNITLPDLNRFKELNEQLGKQKTALQELGNVSKQALENGLNQFLTDGVNNSDSLSDAFRDMLTSIAQEIQAFYAKRLVQSLMTLLFGEGNQEYQQDRFGNIATSTGMQPNGRVMQAPDYSPYYNAQNPRRPEVPSVYSGSSIKTANEMIEEESVTDVDLSSLEQSASSASTAVDGLTQSLQSVGTGAQELSTGLQTVNSNATILSETSNSLNNALTQLQQSAYSASIALSSVGSDTGSSVTAATGGHIKGPGTGTSDSIPAMLSNGEYVVKASAVKKYGTNFLDSVNSGHFSSIPRRRIAHFADGGLAATGAQNTAEGLRNLGSSIGSNVSTTANFNVALVRDENEAMQSFMKSREGQRIMLDFSRRNASFSSTMGASY